MGAEVHSPREQLEVSGQDLATLVSDRHWKLLGPSLHQDSAEAVACDLRGRRSGDVGLSRREELWGLVRVLVLLVRLLVLLVRVVFVLVLLARLLLVLVLPPLHPLLLLAPLAHLTSLQRLLSDAKLSVPTDSCQYAEQPTDRRRSDGCFSG